MRSIGNYTIVETIEAAKHFALYRAEHVSTGRTVTIESLHPEDPAPSDIARFRRELSLIRGLRCPGIIPIIDLIEEGDTFALVLESWNGITLGDMLKSKKTDVNRFLAIASSLAGTLGAIHKNGIIHREIRPHNIFVQPESCEVKITGFGLSYLLTGAREDIYDPRFIHAALRYVSPEQTGRMNREVDYRSDLYSLGITLYEILTGTVPFLSDDPMEMIHAHLARVPKPPDERDFTVPEALSRITQKLLAKTPEERYQSSFGLLADLQECALQYGATGRISIPVLAGRDFSPQFKIPQSLVGRDDEIGRIMEAFEDASRGASKIVMVSGQPGIGKSALINEIQKPVIAKRGYFITGKYDQFRRDVPYSAMFQAFQELVRQILAESDEMIARWKERLLESLGLNGRIVIEVIPAVELITGRQPEVPELGQVEMQNRFIHVFKKFMEVFARPDHPLVLFLDDLQWADSASLELLRMLLADSEAPHLLFIGSYRDSEVNGAHPLMRTIRDIRNEGKAIHEITVGGLGREGVNLLVSNLLRCEPAESLELAGLIYDKTVGNPFFVNQFLKTLYDGGLIELTTGGWRWDMDAIQKMEVTDNVVELLAEKISRLAKNPRDLMKICACVGNWFDLETLAVLYEKTIEETLADLTIAINEGLVHLSGKIYRFHHDRIHEAAYSLLADEEKSRIHYRLGRHLLSITEKNNIADSILYITSQLNAGARLIGGEDERIGLAELNLSAGRKASASAAYEQALAYFETGITLIDKEGWERNYRLAIDLHIHAAGAAFLNTNFKLMEERVRTVLSRGRTLVEKVPVYELRMKSLYARNKLPEAIQEGLQVLKLLGITFPENPRLFHVAIELVKTKFSLLNKDITELNEIKDMDRPIALAIMRVMSDLGVLIYVSRPKLIPLVILQGVRLSLRHGNAPESAFGFAGYGLMLCGAFGRIDEGYRFGQLASALANRASVKKYKARTNYLAVSMIRHWKIHYRELLPSLMDIFQLAVETGDMEYATLAAHDYCNFAFSMGRPLPAVTIELMEYSTVIRKYKQKTNLNYNEIIRQTALNFMIPSADPCTFAGEAYSESRMMPIHHENMDKTALFYVYLYKLVLSCHFERYDQAVQYSDEALKYIDTVLGQFHVVIFYFYDSLCRLAIIGNNNLKKRKPYLKTVTLNQKKLKMWSNHAPMNLLHKYQLVEAEKSRIMDKSGEAMNYYAMAITGASDNGFLQEEALAHLLAGKFYIAYGQSEAAAIYLGKAVACYRKWGAAAMVGELQRSYDGFLRHTANGPENIPAAYSAASAIQDLDINTIVKTSQALSGEIDLTRLLEKIMKITMENAGARKGFLILNEEKNNTLYIEAAGDVEKGTGVISRINVQSSHDLPVSIINYVNKTGESIVLNNAVEDPRFAVDPFIAQNRTRSIICAPIINKRKLSGIIYLENNLATGVFTPGRLEILRILSSQAAISIENARLVSIEKEKAVLDKEIEMAQTIQKSLLPQEVPKIPGVSLAFKYVPMIGVGGDFIDICYDRERRQLGLFICDVVGHGVYASFLSSMTKTALHSWKANVDRPLFVLHDIRDHLVENLGYNFITACICNLDLRTGNLTFANAGHPPIAILRNDGSVELLSVRGRIINKYIPPDFLEKTVTLSKGEWILLYTDGITEAANSQGIMVGADDDEKFCRWIKIHFGNMRSPDEVCSHIYDGVIDHSGKIELEDDFTVLACHYTGS